MDDHAARYRAYLARFGIAEAGDRVVEMRELEAGGVRFFAYADGAGLRLKAAVTPAGLVTPGPQASDDWYGYLTEMGDGGAAAEGIAWLETDEAATPDGFPPAEWTAMGATLDRSPDGAILLVALFLPGGIPIPQQWAIRAWPNAAAEIDFSP